MATGKRGQLIFCCTTWEPLVMFKKSLFKHALFHNVNILLIYILSWEHGTGHKTDIHGYTRTLKDLLYVFFILHCFTLITKRFPYVDVLHTNEVHPVHITHQDLSNLCIFNILSQKFYSTNSGAIVHWWFQLSTGFYCNSSKKIVLLMTLNLL